MKTAVHASLPLGLQVKTIIREKIIACLAKLILTAKTTKKATTMTR